MSGSNHLIRPDSKRGFWISGAVSLAILGAVVLTALISLRRDVSPIECFKLEQLKNVSVARLENSHFRETRHAAARDLSLAAEGFEELAEKLPQDSLGVHNLAISRLLQLESQAISADEAHAAADRMLQLEERSADAYWLAGQIARAAGDHARSVAELARAAERAPKDASIWYSISQLCNDSQDDAEKKRGYEALGRAYQASPENLFLQAAWLKAQIEARDPLVLETLRALRQIPAGDSFLSESLDKHGQSAELSAVVKETETSIQQGDWNALEPLLALADAVQSKPRVLQDLHRVDRQPWESIRLDFRRPCDEHQLSEAAPIDVKFSEWPADVQLPPLLGVADLQLADVDLDGRLDLIVLREEAIEIYQRSGPADNWRPGASARLLSGSRGVLLADLDSDDPTNSDPNEFAGAEAGHRAALDLVVYGESGIAILRNEAGADGSRVLNPAEAPQMSALESVFAAAANDFDNDGDLDLVFSSSKGISLWSNRGGFRFGEVSQASRLPPTSLQARAIEPVDWDADGNLDLMLVGPGGDTPGWLEGLRHGGFRWRQFEDGFSSLRD